LRKKRCQSVRLKIMLPHEVFLDKKVSKVIAEGTNGYFCLLPRHVDFVSALVPGIFMLADGEGKEEFLALDEGILVKCDREVLVSARNAIAGASLESLKAAVEDEFKKLDEQEELARTVLAKLEVDTIRRILELGGKSGEGSNT